MILHQSHADTYHGGIQMMMAYIRSAYWIRKLREESRYYVSKCQLCERHADATTKQIMGNLPQARLTPARPFLRCGVDMAGPFLLKLKEGKQHNLRSKTQDQMLKGYVAVFVCLVTRAVHLEPVMDMSADAFKNAFLRFIARRGPCELMMSDNGTNFVAANKDLKEAHESWQSRGLMHNINAEGTTWQFITPAAPHEGGLWEAAVKSMKHHLRRVMGVHKYTYEGIATLLAGIEACLNSRPLCAITDDPNDAEKLTPAHFFIGGPLKLPLPFAAGTKPNEIKGRQLYNHLRKQQDDFWKAWSSDYLSSLMQRKKWRAETLKLDRWS